MVVVVVVVVVVARAVGINTLDIKLVPPYSVRRGCPANSLGIRHGERSNLHCAVSEVFAGSWRGRAREV